MCASLQAMKLKIEIIDDIIQLNENIHELNGCRAIFNGAFITYSNTEYLIARCNLLNKYDKGISEFKLISPTGIRTLHITDSIAFKTWNVGSVQNYLGPEDPRVFEHQNELYLYYSMSNPNRYYPMRSLEYIKIKDVLELTPHTRYNESQRTFLRPDIFGTTNYWVEKNWLFFSNTTSILAIYGLKPFIIGDVYKNDFTALFQRDYDCLSNLENTHISSNAITISSDNKILNAFVFNEKIRENDRNDKPQYKSYMGYFEAYAPFRLLHIAPLQLNINSSSFIYIENISILNKNKLHANENDTLIFTGGVDDSSIFYKELKVKTLLNMNKTTCQIKYNEMDYFMLSSFKKPITANATTVCTIENSLKYQKDVWMTVSFVLTFVIIVIGYHKYRHVYRLYKRV